MASSYPGGLDSFTNPAAGNPLNSPSHSTQHADANDAIEAVQAELGIDPAGASSTVAARLDILGAATTTASGYPLVINVTDPHPDISAVAAVGDASTDNTTALQNIFDWLKGNKANDHIVWFPKIRPNGNTADYRISEPLRVWTNTRIMGPATISPTASFDWTNHPHYLHADYRPVGVQQPGDIALMELWNDVNGRGSFSRIFLDEIDFNCRSQPGSIGLLWKLQQPARTWRARVRNADIAAVIWGQQSEHFLMQLEDCDVGLHLGGDPKGVGTGAGAGAPGGEFHTFFSLNIEGYAEAAVYSLSDAPGYNTILQGHFENQSAGPQDGSTKLLDLKEGRLTIRDSWGSHSAAAGDVFVIGDDSPTPAVNQCVLAIHNFRLASSDAGGAQLMIDDKIRPYTRKVDLQRSVGTFRTAFQNDTQQDYDADWELIGDEGGFVRIGGTKGGTAAPTGHSGAQFTVQSNTSQDEPMVRFRDSGGTTRTAVHESGNLTLASYTDAGRPAASSVDAGTMIYNTDDNAPNISDGTNWRAMDGTTT